MTWIARIAESRLTQWVGARRNRMEKDSRDDDGLPAVVSLSDHFKSGVAEIDADHGNIVGLLNAALVPAATPAVRDASLQRLIDALLDHIESEEKFLRGLGYSRIDEHSRRHRQIVQFARERCDAVRAGTVALRRAIHDIHEALLTHFLYDLEYKSFVAEFHKPARG